MEIILLFASNNECDNKNLQLVSRVLVSIVTIITVYCTISTNMKPNLLKWSHESIKSFHLFMNMDL